MATVGLRIDGFLNTTLENAGINLKYEIQDAAPAEDDFETPDVHVKFSGPDVDLLLSNRAELLLSLEHVTMEMLHMPSEDHSRISFDANDYRLLRIEELAAQRRCRRRPRQAHRHLFLFQPDEQPRAPRDSSGAAQRKRGTQRKRRHGTGPHGHRLPAGMPSLAEPPRPPEPRRRERSR